MDTLDIKQETNIAQVFYNILEPLRCCPVYESL